MRRMPVVGLSMLVGVLLAVPAGLARGADAPAPAATPSDDDPPPPTEGPGVEAHGDDALDAYAALFGSLPGPPVGGTGTGPVLAASATPPPSYLAPALRVEDDYITACLYLERVQGDPSSTEGQYATEMISYYLDNGIAMCESSPEDVPEAPSPAAQAARLWRERVRLPSPELWIAPGHAITGLPAFLEIDGPSSNSWPFGPEEAAGWAITLHADSTYDVDWGDGHVRSGVRSQGGPWPDGDLHHTYQHRAEENVVVVTRRWSARWEATGPGGATAGGSIADPLTTVASLPLGIREVQAVVE
jgi:hypothetical protein